MTKSQLLAKAKRDYPIGTIYISPLTGKKRKIIGNNFIYGIEVESIDVDRGWYVYYHGEWAEILFRPELSISEHLDECQPPVKPFPKRMLCWDNGAESDKAEVFVLNKAYGKFHGVYIEDKELLNELYCREGQEGSILVTFQNAEDIVINPEIAELKAKIKADTARLNKLLSK